MTVPAKARPQGRRPDPATGRGPAGEADARFGQRVAGRLTAVRARALLFVVGGLVGFTACAPTPSATERYCDVAKLDQATLDPFSVAAVLADPVRLRTAVESRDAILTQRLAVAPDAVRADLTTMQDVQRKVQSALSLAGYRSSAANDPAVQALLVAGSYSEAKRNVGRFDAKACAVSVDQPTTTAPVASSLAPTSTDLATTTSSVVADVTASTTSG